MTPMLQMSVEKSMGSYWTTSGAMNSGVPNITLVSTFGSNSLAKPKSIILIRFPDFDRQRIFSGCSKKNNFQTYFTKKSDYIAEIMLNHDDIDEADYDQDDDGNDDDDDYIEEDDGDEV